ncbi:MAG: c-type cytochrome domain-containing protein [Saprospiraceae bacterium]
MRLFTIFIGILVGFSFFGLFLGGCVHDPIFISKDPLDTITMDSTNQNACDTNIIYFQNQVLPIFQSSCALSGCHDPIKHEEGLILDTYQNILRTGDIRANNPSSGDIYKLISSQDPKKRMPPPPMNALSIEQQNLIYNWILQGAKNDSCKLSGNCNLIAISYSKEVLPIINTNCKVCHSGTAPLGNLSLTSYTEVKSIANNGKLVCSINWNVGCVSMPKGGKKLDVCSIQKIEAWIQQGGLNN